MQPCEKEKERIHKIQNNSRVLQYINDVRQVHECKYMNYSWLYLCRNGLITALLVTD